MRYISQYITEINIFVYLLLFSIGVFISLKEFYIYNKKISSKTLFWRERYFILGISYLLISLTMFFQKEVCLNNPLTLFIVIAFPLLVDMLIDFEFKELSDNIALFILLVGAINLIGVYIYIGFDAFISRILNGVIAFIIYLVIAMLSVLGGGDIKLIGAMGIYFELEFLRNLLLYPLLISFIPSVLLLVFYYIKVFRGYKKCTGIKKCEGMKVIKKYTINKQKMKIAKKPMLIAMGPYIIIGFILLIFMRGNL